MNYWLECVESSLDEMGVLDKLTEEQRKQLAEDVETSHSMYGEAHGHHFIPNPLQTEMNNLKQRHKRDLEEAERTQERHRKEWQDVVWDKNRAIGNLQDKIEELRRQGR